METIALELRNCSSKFIKKTQIIFLNFKQLMNLLKDEKPNCLFFFPLLLSLETLGRGCCPLEAEWAMHCSKLTQHLIALLASEANLFHKIISELKVELLMAKAC